MGRINPQPPKGAADTNSLVKRVETFSAPASEGGFVGKHTVNYSTTGGSPTVYEVWYALGGSSLASYWLNENGAPRAAMPKPSDAGLKVVGWGKDQTTHTFAIETRNGTTGGTGGRSTVWAVNKDNKVVVGPNEVVTIPVVAVAAGATVAPEGTPLGALIVRPRT